MSALYRDALAYAKARRVVLPEVFYGELRGRARRLATTVSHLGGLSQIAEVIDSLDTALAQGETLRQWQDRVGEAIGQLSPSRRETVFRTNIQQLYMAGIDRAQRHPASLRDRPFFMYDAINDSRTRPGHAAMDGFIATADDPVWQSINPPAGFNCRCSRIALTEAEALARGYTPGQGLPPGAAPDDGWGHDDAADPEARIDRLLEGRMAEMPGALAGAAARAQARERESARLWDRHGALDDCGEGWLFASEKACLRALPGQPDWRALSLPDLRDLRPRWAAPAPEMLPAADSKQAARALLRRELGVATDGSTRVITPLREVVVADWTLAHIVDKRADARERYARFILPTLQDPLEVWRTEYADGPRERYVKLFSGRNDLLVVARLNPDDSLLWNVIPTRLGSVQAQRVGALVWNKYR